MKNIQELENKIVKYSKAYYDGHPIISDAEFDKLLEELKKINPKHHLLTDVGHGYIQTDIETVTHPLLIKRGLPKQKVEKETILPAGYITPKYDGSSVTIYYENGKLKQAITRGNGITGTDRTEILKYIIPNNVDTNIKVVTGEWVLSYENFNKYYDNNETNAIRNIATGALMKKNITIEEIKRFHFVAYRINEFATNINISYPQILKLLRDNGFVTPNINIKSNSDTFINLFNKIKGYSHRGYTFPYDGLVFNTGITITDGYVEYDNELAYKIITETADVTVTKVEWNHTNTGRYIPLVWFEPINLSGARIEKATGHNAQNILDKGIDVGAVVTITRSGEVIPYIVDVVKSVKAELPEKCVDCGNKLKWSGVHLVCDNEDCNGNSYNKLYNYIKTVGAVKGVSNKIIDGIIKFASWEKIEDIYNNKIINYSNLINYDGFGESALELISVVIDKLYNNIPFDKFLLGLTITDLGEKNAAKYKNDIYKYLTDKNMTVFDNYTPHIKEVIVNSLSYIEKIYNLISNIIVSPTVNSTTDAINVCITGKLSMNRKEFVELLKIKGYIESTIAKATMLICNEPSTSSKYKYAVKNNIPIITEDDFVNKYIK